MERREDVSIFSPKEIRYISLRRKTKYIKGSFFFLGAPEARKFDAYFSRDKVMLRQHIFTLNSSICSRVLTSSFSFRENVKPNALKFKVQTTTLNLPFLQ